MESVQQHLADSSELRAHLVSALHLAETLSTELDRVRAERDQLLEQCGSAPRRKAMPEAA